MYIFFKRRYNPAKHTCRRFCLYYAHCKQKRHNERFHPSCCIFFYDAPRARSPDIHACLAKVAEIRWKRCVPGSKLGIARLRETIMLQMMYLRMTDSKSAAREGEGVQIFACYPRSDGLSYRCSDRIEESPCPCGSPCTLVAKKNGNARIVILIAIR